MSLPCHCLNNLVASCQQAVDNLSTNWEQAVRTHLVDKLLEQHCYNQSAAGLIVTTCGFYVCTLWFSFVSNHQTDVTSFDQFLKLILFLFILLFWLGHGGQGQSWGQSRGRVQVSWHLTPLPSSENDVTSVRLLEISAYQKATVTKYPNTPLYTHYHSPYLQRYS